jgi:hypothetical protein
MYCYGEARERPVPIADAMREDASSRRRRAQRNVPITRARGEDV